jgi:hypothetical protein
MKKVILPVLTVLMVSPLFASAQQYFGNIGGIITSIGHLVKLALPVVIGLALLAFFYGLLKFIFNGGDEEKRKESIQVMIYGVIALFVMVSVWGLVRFVGNSLGVNDQGGSLPVPTVQGL